MGITLLRRSAKKTTATVISKPTPVVDVTTTYLLAFNEETLNTLNYPSEIKEGIEFFENQTVLKSYNDVVINQAMPMDTVGEDNFMTWFMFVEVVNKADSPTGVMYNTLDSLEAPDATQDDVNNMTDEQLASYSNEVDQYNNFCAAVEANQDTSSFTSFLIDEEKGCFDLEGVTAEDLLALISQEMLSKRKFKCTLTISCD
jgi:hypothetical protein